MSNKISYTCGTATEPLIGMTIGDAFDQTVAQYPDNEAIVSVHQQIRYSYWQLQKKVDQCAKAFMALGITKGDRVGIWSPNGVEWLITQIATSKIGAILVNINPSYRLNELEYALRQSGCKAIVSADRFKDSDYTEMLYEIAPEIKTSDKTAVSSEKLPELKHIISLSKDSRKGMLLWSDFIGIGKEVRKETLAEVQAGLNFDDPINIQYTSGTTGYPKGATLSHHNILNNGYLVTKVQNFSSQDRLVIPVPLYHCFGMVMGNLGCISHGATMIYPKDSFEPRSVLETVEKEKATALYGVPTMFFALLNHPDFKQFDMSSLRTGIMAGSLCPSELMKRVNKEMHIAEMEIAYGMTETSPVSTQTRHDAPFEKQVSTVGRIMPHTEIKIIDPETQQIVPIGEKGELCTRGYCVMLGYWNDTERTAEAIDDARWMHTGDIAIMDGEGYISIVGRIKDMIIRGGENIYPKEIEEFLSRHEAISNVQVIGVPDEKYGETVCAWVQLSRNAKLSPEEIIAYCKGQIAHYKIPKYIKFVEDFPITVTGKVRKIEMRKSSAEAIKNGSDQIWSQ